MRSQVFVGLLVFVVAGCSEVLPHETSTVSAKFQTYDQLMTAYDAIEIGKTRATDLAALGFDPKTTPNIQVLSYVQIIEYFVPSEAVTLQRIPKSVRTCLEAQDHCSAYVYRLQHSATRHNGGVVPDLVGIERDTTRVGWSAEIILLLRDDQIAYKVISARPYQQDQFEKSQPLGPLQDLGKMLVDGASP